MAVEMRLVRIVISEISDGQFVYLREVDGAREFAMVIGLFEASRIDLRVRNERPPRPLTHDLIVNIVESLGAELDSVIIHELKEGTYYAKLRVKRDGEIIDIDSRPSDAIATAVCSDPPLPIFVEEDVIDESMQQTE